MHLVYLSYLFIFGIIYLMYLVYYNQYQISHKHIFIGLSITLIIFSFLLMGYINIKNQMTESTYQIYQSFHNSLSQTSYSNQVDTIEDVEKLLIITKDINKNLSMLEYGLKYAEIELQYEDNGEFHKLIKDLNDYLTLFIYQHDELYTNNRYIDDALRIKYSKIKTELNILYDYFRLVRLSPADKAGTVKVYYLVSKEENFHWKKKVLKRLRNISDLVNKDLNVE